MGEDEHVVTPAGAGAKSNGSDVEALKQLEKALLAKIDDAVGGIQRTRLADGPREHLEILRTLLKAQISAYLEHFTARATLFTQTSTMYASAVGTKGIISTTLRGLIEGHTLTAAQAKLLARFVAERRTLVVFGDRATGKSTLLNALFELISVDERFVSVERDAHLPALRRRSFCVRLSMDDDTDVAGLFAKAEKMQPSRLVVGELHGEEILHFFDLLYRNAKIGGMATLRADSMHDAVELLLVQLEQELDREPARKLLAQTKPVFAHSRSDEHGRPRLAAVWSVSGLDSQGEILLGEETAQASTRLVAEA
ncbi:MAG TPA: ATPase, T2SS/T4P/T4SS family [Thermoleophilia bacterium]|nr:ATPase, T2SS/T4P/T4SS family [Thermoleophilia bacterium]